MDIYFILIFIGFTVAIVSICWLIDYVGYHSVSKHKDGLDHPPRYGINANKKKEFIPKPPHAILRGGGVMQCRNIIKCPACEKNFDYGVYLEFYCPFCGQHIEVMG